MLKLLSFIGIALISSQALATHDFTCFGAQNGTRLVIKGELPKKSIAALSKASGDIYVNGREVGRFDSGDLKTNIFRKAFQVETQQGDTIDGKVTDIGKMKALIDMKIRAYGIELYQFPVKCVY